MRIKGNNQSFNPRARDGREYFSIQYLAVFAVSIHAPVMDAKDKDLYRQHGLCFNPRARDGRERRSYAAKHSGVRFNPRARDGRETISATL